MKQLFSPRQIWKITSAGTLTLLLASSGCARLDYVKVPTGTQYDQWDDAKQAKADSMRGVRYYLPRPFLHLKQSTPVAQRTVLVSFTWSESEKAYVLEGPEKLPTWVQKVAPRKISITQALALTLAAPKGGPGGGGSQGGDVGAGTNGPAAGPNASNAEKPPSELHARTGFLNASDPVTRLGSRFDVVYLPDFEEQFVIRPKAGIGKADIETQLRNGWAAEVFSQKVDNSNLIPYVINQFENASSAAANIFTTWGPVAAGLPPNLGIPKAAAGGSQGGTIDGATVQDLNKLLGQVLLFKLAEVRVAQPGLYPILKPSEVRRVRRTASGAIAIGADPEASLDLLVQTAGMPWIRQDMAFIPCPPFTVIGFNTTSDLFIAPATERIVIDTVTEKDNPNKTDSLIDGPLHTTPPPPVPGPSNPPEKRGPSSPTNPTPPAQPGPASPTHPAPPSQPGSVGPANTTPPTPRNSPGASARNPGTNPPVRPPGS